MKSSGNGGGKGSHIIAPPRRKVTRKKVMLRVEVQDTGIGIEANIIPHLFHAFEQGDSSITIRFGGLGLGLAISRSLVEMHSGALSADSEGKGKGATFTIVLPTIHTSTPSPQLAAAAAAALPPGVTLGATGGARRSSGGASAAAKFAAQQAPSASIRKAAMSPSFTLGSLSKMRARDSAAGSLDLPARRPGSSSTPSSPSATAAASSSSPGLPPSLVTSASSSTPPTPATSPSSTANRSGAMHPGLQQFAMNRGSGAPPRTLAGFPSTPSPSPAGAGAGAAAGGSMMAQYPMPPAFCIRSRSTPILPSASYASSSLIAGSVSPLRPAASIRPLKVLLVEDNKSTLLIMSRLLQQRLGYQVFVASTVKDALDVRRLPPARVVCDVWCVSCCVVCRVLT
jgi:CheY-like chemotaxis protein